MSKKPPIFLELTKMTKIGGFFLHFSSCMRDKLILSLDLCYGDQCTYFDKSHAILLDNFIFSLHKGVAVGRLSLRTLKIGENIPLT